MSVSLKSNLLKGSHYSNKNSENPSKGLLSKLNVSIRASTFEVVIRWKDGLDTKVTLPDGNPVPCVLIANKVNKFGFD